MKWDLSTNLANYGAPPCRVYGYIKLVTMGVIANKGPLLWPRHFFGQALIFLSHHLSNAGGIILQDEWKTWQQKLGRRSVGETKGGETT